MFITIMFEKVSDLKNILNILRLFLNKNLFEYLFFEIYN